MIRILGLHHLINENNVSSSKVDFAFCNFEVRSKEYTDSPLTDSLVNFKINFANL